MLNFQTKGGRSTTSSTEGCFVPYSLSFNCLLTLKSILECFSPLHLCVRRRFWGNLGATRGSGGFFVPVSQILDKRRRIWYNGDDGGGPLCPPPNNIEQEENTMFQFEITGNVRNEQIILEDYNTQGGKKTKRAVITISTKTSGKFPSFLDIVVYGLSLIHI